MAGIPHPLQHGQGARALAKKYINHDKYPWRRPDEVRVTYKILPEKIHTLG
jgi:hypothetical protein